MSSTWYSVISLIFFLFCLYLAFRLNITSFVDGIQKLAGYYTGVTLLFFATPVVAMLLLMLGPTWIGSMFQPVYNQYANQEVPPLIAQTGDSIQGILSGQGASNASSGQSFTSNSATHSGDTYTVQAGDSMNEIADNLGVSRTEFSQFNADIVPNPDVLEVGTVLKIPGRAAASGTTITTSDTVPTAKPPIIENLVEASVPTIVLQGQVPNASGNQPRATPTPEPERDFSAELAQIMVSKNVHNIDKASAAVDAILKQAPTHSTALGLRTELDKAIEQKALWANLSSQGKEQHQAVVASLRGYKFVVISKEEKTFASVWNRTVTIQVSTPGWLYGYQIMMPFGHVHNITLKYAPVGREFVVQ